MLTFNLKQLPLKRRLNSSMFETRVASCRAKCLSGWRQRTVLQLPLVEVCDKCSKGEKLREEETREGNKETR